MKKVHLVSALLLSTNLLCSATELTTTAQQTVSHRELVAQIDSRLKTMHVKDYRSGGTHRDEEGNLILRIK